MMEWKPTTNFSKTIAEARKLCLGGNNDCQQLLKIAMLYMSDTHELTSSGVCGIGDIMDATKEEGKKLFFDKVVKISKFNKAMR